MSAYGRRRRLWRRGLPWLAALTIAALVGWGLHRAFVEEDLVGIAAAMRVGDPAREIDPDPVGALEVLETLLSEQPDHYDAWIESAKAWQELRSWDNAVDALDHAAECAPALSGQVYAMNLATALLMIANRYDEAVAMGGRVAELYPGQGIRRTSIGTIHLTGSEILEREVLARFVDPIDKRMRDVAVEDAVEAFISDVWGTPDVDELLDQVIPGADPVLREEIRQKLLLARERFLLADEVLADYPQHAGFDASVARAYCKVLLRTGRLYDAHVEAAIALRQPGLPEGIQRDFLDAQAHGAMAVGDFAQAAGRYGVLLAAFAESGEDPPALLVWDLYEALVRAGKYEWILANVEADAETYGDDPVLRWAQAEALVGLDRRKEALDVLREPFNLVALGSKTSMSFSLRGWPDRRRSILMLAYRLFHDQGDSRAGTALDALLSQDPTDKEALRLRADLATAEGRLEAAETDSLALHTRDARDPADFKRWLDAADRASAQRTGVGLVQRAAGRVRDVLDQLDAQKDSGVEAFRALGVRQASRVPPTPDALFFPGDPALSFTIVTELVAQGEIERARLEMRKLADRFPAVQEFRFRLGRLLVRAGMYAEALREFEQIWEDRPDDAEALDLATRAYRAMGDDVAAARLLNQMILDDPLGISASWYGQRLLEQGRTDEVERLVERFVRHTRYGERPDVLVLAARSRLALGDAKGAQAILGPLATVHVENLDVALLALDVGIATDQTGIAQAAVRNIRSLAHGLLPDQMAAIAARLHAAGRMDALVEIFDEEIAALPAARSVLHLVAAGHKALGNFDEARGLLARIDDGESLLDRFLLLALQGREREIEHKLRLRPTGDAAAREVELCLLVADVLDGSPALADAVPGARLRRMGLGAQFLPHELELLDALLRILPSLARLHPIEPAAAVELPDQAWPLAGGDVKLLLELGLADRELARRVATSLMFMVLLGERPFWEREARQLAEDVLVHVPGLVQPRRVLARAALADGRAEEALGLLQPLLVNLSLQPDDLRLFLQACYDHGRSEWGVATALFLEGDPEALLVLADALASWDHPAEARDLYRRVLDERPGDLTARAGLIAALATLDEGTALLEVMAPALAAYPDDEDFARVCAESLGRLGKPASGLPSVLGVLFDAWPALPELGVGLARAFSGAPEEQRRILETLVQRLDEGVIRLDSAEVSKTLVRAARLARTIDADDLATALSEAALLAEPGSLTAIRELAYLHLESRRLDIARRHLEVLSFVDPDDKGASMSLAQLYFQQLGQPTRAADVVRRTWPGAKPIEAVEILAAESYLGGRPAEALNLFRTIANSPGITPDTYLTVARIAYASGQDVVARTLYDQVLRKLGPKDPRRPRADWLRNVRLAVPDASPPAAPPPKQAGG